MAVKARAPRIAQSAPARTEEGERPSCAARGSGAFLPQSVKARCGPRGSQNAPAQTEEGERPTRAARDSGACLPQSVGVDRLQNTLPRATGGPDVRGNFGLVSCLRRACAKARSHFIRVQTGDGVASAAAILALQIVYAEFVPTRFCILYGSKRQPPGCLPRPMDIHCPGGG